MLHLTNEEKKFILSYNKDTEKILKKHGYKLDPKFKAIVAKIASDEETEESNVSGGLPQTLRGDSKEFACNESGEGFPTGRLIEQFSDVKEGRVFKVVLISEGMGNMKNKNYYGPEAIESAPAAFEGKSCFLDHPSRSEEGNRPERSVRDKCGYFKNLGIEEIEGKLTCSGELHMDLSESGRLGAEKLITSLHYREEFPSGEGEYVGLSVNSDGETERRTVATETGESIEANYVMRFTDAASCDIVTVPARGGRALALLESDPERTKEERNMKSKIVEELRNALGELKESKDPKVAKAREGLTKLCESAERYASEAEAEARKQAEADEMEAKKKEALKAKEDEAKKKEMHVDDEEEKEDVMESKRIAVEGMLREAGVSKEHVNLTRLLSMRIVEAKEEIARAKNLRESIVKETVSKIGAAPFHGSKLAESGTGENMNSRFAGLCG